LGEFEIYGLKPISQKTPPSNWTKFLFVIHSFLAVEH